MDEHPPDPERSRALLVAVSEYTDTRLPSYPQLGNAARRLAELLQDPEVWGLPPQHCTVLEGRENTTADAILDAVDKAADEAEAALFLYIAAHGATRDRKLHLAHSSARIGELGRWIPWEQIRGQLESRIGDAHQLIIIDACQSGTALHESMPRGDSALLTSCSSTERSWVDPDGRLPAYTGAVIEVLEKGVGIPDPLLSPLALHRAVAERLTGFGQQADMQLRGHSADFGWTHGQVIVADPSESERPATERPASRTPRESAPVLGSRGPEWQCRKAEGGCGSSLTAIEQLWLLNSLNGRPQNSLGMKLRPPDPPAFETRAPVAPVRPKPKELPESREMSISSSYSWEVETQRDISLLLAFWGEVLGIPVVLAVFSAAAYGERSDTALSVAVGVPVAVWVLVVVPAVATLNFILRRKSARRRRDRDLLHDKERYEAGLLENARSDARADAEHKNRWAEYDRALARFEEAREQNKAEHREMLERWRKGMYCERCGTLWAG